MTPRWTPRPGNGSRRIPDGSPTGILISQLCLSTLIDPGEILREYEATRFPDRFYNLKIGVAWVDKANRLSTDEVLRLCGPMGILERSSASCTMGVDTGRELHVVIARPRGDRREIVYIGVHAAFDELDDLIRRFNVYRCVIDGLPGDARGPRAGRCGSAGIVYLNFFNHAPAGNARGGIKRQLHRQRRTGPRRSMPHGAPSATGRSCCLDAAASWTSSPST